MFEHYALAIGGDKDAKYVENYKKLVDKVENSSKKDMMEHGGYDEIVIDDFYELFLEELKKLETLK